MLYYVVNFCNFVKIIVQAIVLHLSHQETIQCIMKRSGIGDLPAISLISQNMAMPKVKRRKRKKSKHTQQQIF